MKKLTEPQLEKLFAFTKKHYVAYYDLQLELVDHLSNGIEAQWHENEKLSFEAALQKEFKKFGIFGFTDLVSERQAKMSRRYNKLILAILKTYITLPRLVISVTLFLTTFLVLSHIPHNNYVVIVLMVLPIIVMFCKTLQYRMLRKKRLKKAAKLWMFEEVIASYGQSFVLFQLVVHLPQLLTNTSSFSQSFLNSTIGLVVVSGILVLFLLTMFIMIFVIPSKAKAHIIAAHPEYDLV